MKWLAVALLLAAWCVLLWKWRPVADDGWTADCPDEFEDCEP